MIELTTFAQNMPLTSYYLPLRARAEAHRMMLSYGNVPHEIVNVSFPEWGAMKASRELCPFGQLPSIKLENGTVIAQSGAITRYVAKLANLYPSDPALCAESDMVYELAQEMNLISPIVNFFDKDSEDFKLKSETYFASLPAWLEAAQKLLGSKDFFGGSSPQYGVCETILCRGLPRHQGLVRSHDGAPWNAEVPEGASWAFNARMGQARVLDPLLVNHHFRVGFDTHENSPLRYTPPTLSIIPVTITKIVHHLIKVMRHQGCSPDIRIWLPDPVISERSIVFRNQQPGDHKSPGHVSTSHI